jgi:hypothetical protein
LQAADLATADTLLKQRAIGEAMRVLDSEFSYDQISIVIATKIHRIVKEIIGNADPYRVMKDKEIAIAQELYPEIVPLYKDDLIGSLKLAAVANAIDFFKEHSLIREDMKKTVNFAIDGAGCLKTRLKNASKVLYLADNAGEIYFDLPLVKQMRRFADVIYVVKPLPIQNDATLEDVRKAGLESEFGRIMTTGIASPGIIFDLASEEFKQEFEAADLIFAKGMGHYESLSELPSEGRIFYCLMAKCKPVADSLGVPLNSYVAMLR